MGKSSILVIDDDHSVRGLLNEILEDQYSVYEAENGEKGIEKVKSHQPDLVLLDVKMPGKDGFQVCRELKENSATANTPIIFLTASSETQNLVRAFHLGADDFIEKPFQILELTSRIGAKLRGKKTPETLQMGEILLNPKSMLVKIRGEVIPFSALEFNLLKFFMQERNNVVSREVVLKHVWGNVCVTDRTVDTHIVSLRKKIANSDCKLQTVYGIGYRFCEEGSSVNSEIPSA
jgi:two-component system phosphate regulon response regulator PhoB